MPSPQSKVYVPFVRRTAMAQSSSCSQKEMKPDWRSIYTRLLRKKEKQQSSYIQKKNSSDFTRSYGQNRGIPGLRHRRSLSGLGLRDVPSWRQV